MGNSPSSGSSSVHEDASIPSGSRLPAADGRFIPEHTSGQQHQQHSSRRALHRNPFDRPDREHCPDPFKAVYGAAVHDGTGGADIPEDSGPSIDTLANLYPIDFPAGCVLSIHERLFSFKYPCSQLHFQTLICQQAEQSQWLGGDACLPTYKRPRPTCLPGLPCPNMSSPCKQRKSLTYLMTYF